MMKKSDFLKKHVEIIIKCLPQNSGFFLEEFDGISQGMPIKRYQVKILPQTSNSALSLTQAQEAVIQYGLDVKELAGLSHSYLSLLSQEKDEYITEFFKHTKRYAFPIGIHEIVELYEKQKINEAFFVRFFKEAQHLYDFFYHQNITQAFRLLKQIGQEEVIATFIQNQELLIENNIESQEEIRKALVLAQINLKPYENYSFIRSYVLSTPRDMFELKEANNSRFTLSLDLSLVLWHTYSPKGDIQSGHDYYHFIRVFTEQYQNYCPDFNFIITSLNKSITGDIRHVHLLIHKNTQESVHQKKLIQRMNDYLKIVAQLHLPHSPIHSDDNLPIIQKTFEFILISDKLNADKKIVLRGKI